MESRFINMDRVRSK